MLGLKLNHVSKGATGACVLITCQEKEMPPLLIWSLCCRLTATLYYIALLSCGDVNSTQDSGPPVLNGYCEVFIDYGHMVLCCNIYDVWFHCTHQALGMLHWLSWEPCLYSLLRIHPPIIAENWAAALQSWGALSYQNALSVPLSMPRTPSAFSESNSEELNCFIPHT